MKKETATTAIDSKTTDTFASPATAPHTEECTAQDSALEGKKTNRTKIAAAVAGAAVLGTGSAFAADALIDENEEEEFTMEDTDVETEEIEIMDVELQPSVAAAPVAAVHHAPVHRPHVHHVSDSNSHEEQPGVSVVEPEPDSDVDIVILDEPAPMEVVIADDGIVTESIAVSQEASEGVMDSNPIDDVVNSDFEADFENDIIV